MRFVDDRETALQVGYEATDWTEKPDFDRYVAALEGWTVRLMVRGNEPVGTAYTQGAEFHVSIRPEWRGLWATRSVLKALIQRPLSITRVTPGHEHVNGLLERLGFEHRGDGLFVKEDPHGH